ncbi:RNA methyltransferase [Candidatus Desantisbacteria bacterium]|nr:RNA methyltransferase [Candidatus Desantisbacteria bacterium]
MRTSKSLQNKIKLISILHDKKIRMKENKFVLEGVRIIESALASNADIDFILYTKDILKNDRGKSIVNKCEENGIESFQVTGDVIASVSHVETSQGIAGVAFCKEDALSKIPLDKKNLTLIIMDSVQDPGNIGTIIRIGEASGADGIILSKGCVDIYNPKTTRASMGAIFNIPVIKVEDLKETLKMLKKQNIKIIATDVNAKKNYFDYDSHGKTAFLLGNEAQGLKSDLISLADVSIKIPIFGKSESLNVSTAASIIIYEHVRQNWKELVKHK